MSPAPGFKITPKTIPKTDAELLACLASWEWRIFSGQLYRIIVKGDDDDDDDPGTQMPFIPNAAQRRFMKNLHYRNLILKARQLGFTTLIAILWLDHALFNADQRCGIIAQTERDVLVIFRDKVRFAYNNLPEFLRKLMPLKKDSAEELLFAHNNSSVRVGLSMRSGTIHRLHISEMGKIAAKTPDKALEIVTGSFPTVPSNGIIVIESTAEGQSGEFFKIAQKAQKLWEIGRKLTRAEFRFHFFPWMDEPKYKSDPTHVYISPEQHKYFDGVQTLMKRIISLPQRAWWVEKLNNDFSGEEDKMWREMPSTPQECWQKSTEGTFFAKQLTAARMQGRIGDVPHVTHVPVNTFWDIGSGDGTAIWLHQYIGAQNRFIGFIEGWDEGYEFYVKRLRDTGYLFGTMYLPHDAAQTRQLKDTIGSPMDMLHDLAPDWRYMIVPRTPSFQMGIETTRKEFSSASTIWRLTIP